LDQCLDIALRDRRERSIFNCQASSSIPGCRLDAITTARWAEDYGYSSHAAWKETSRNSAGFPVFQSLGQNAKREA
jgi:hypothetical protein